MRILRPVVVLPQARERKIHGVANAPRPLRSENQPDGLADLSTQEQQRVQQANDSYSAMVTLIVLLVQMQVYISIENPVNSLFWLTSFMQKLFQTIGAGHVTILQHCMHGGDRDKTSKFWSFNPRRPGDNLLQSLALMCDCQHTHKSWQPYKLQGKLFFPTKEEAAYPVLLSERLASLFLQETKERGLNISEDIVQQINIDLNVGKRNLFTTQGRGNKLQPLVYPWGQQVEVVLALHKSAIDVALKPFPKGSKILQRLVHRGFCRDVWVQKGALVKSDVQENDDFEVIKVGVPREPFDFLAKAVEVGHPKCKVARTSSVMRRAVDMVFGKSPEEVMAKRSRFLKKYLKRSVALRSDEANLHAKLPIHLQRILRGKKLLLFKEMLSDLNYADVAVVDDIIAGFSLTGWARSTGVFDVKIRPPSLTVEQLQGMAMGLNMAVVGSLKGATWEDIDQTAWDETMLEVERGCLYVKQWI